MQQSSANAFLSCSVYSLPHTLRLLHMPTLMLTFVKCSSSLPEYDGNSDGHSPAKYKTLFKTGALKCCDAIFDAEIWRS